MGIWLEGKRLADKIKEEVREEVAFYKNAKNAVPGLVGILVGENRSSQVYLRGKERTSQEVEISSRILAFPADTSTSFLTARIEELNQDNDVDGILVQLPLPSGLNAQEIIATIRPEKDVDGFHPYNLGNLLMNQEGLKPCTPSGVMELLKFNQIGIEGKEVVIIGRSLIVGKPLAAMMTNAHGTVTICHSKTKDLPQVASRADILVAAMGRAAFVQPEFVKPGATVIDVGINSLADKEKVEELFGQDPKREKDIREKGYTIVGDVHPRAIERAAFMTPVPGGVGLLTRAMLMKNTLQAFKRRRNF
ncbi:MAG: bifunctional 5,10-methylenetetrahydrofolate dehydrogenase/5,10-methenyltetrahydrofolate cyclohydrolase [Candidatus Aminicenantales bacterium]